MKIAPFVLEHYFAKHEFTARYLLSSSDCEALSLTELLSLADSETKQLWADLKLGYTESLGNPLLREAIAEIYDGIGANNLLVVVPAEGIFLLMQALLEPGDHVICTFPAFQSLYEVARSVGCEISTWEPDEDRSWYFDVGQLAEMIQDNTKLVVVNFPHNPTGYIPPLTDFQAIIDLVRQRGIYLFSDEMFRFLEVEEGSTLPAACELYDRALSLFGLSKTFGLPGLRLGWIATQDAEILKRMTDLKYYTTICSSAPSEVLAIMALRSRSTIIEQQLRRVHKNIAVLDTFFTEYDDCFRWNRPRGSSICYPRLLLPQDATTFCEDLVQETGIMLVPSSVFQFGDHHVRIGFGRENLPEVIDLFKDYLDRHFH
jgi:aspartate/methionine/tyrosine aminotransferase